MIIRRGRNFIVFECDVGDGKACHGEFTLNSTDFNQTWAEARAKGWESKKIADEWLHACPGCML